MTLELFAPPWDLRYQKRKEKKVSLPAYYLSWKRLLSAPFPHSFGCNFKPYNPMYHQCQESIERIHYSWRPLEGAENLLCGKLFWQPP